MIRDLNLFVFELVNAPSNADPAVVAMARFLAVDAIWIIPIALVFAWLWGGAKLRKSALEASLAAAVALLVAQLIGAVWYQARPFAAGLGNLLIEHAANSSFPSDHATLIAAIGISLLAHRASRMIGIALVSLLIPVAWARVYVGVHFPADMVGGLLVGACSAAIVRQFGQAVLRPAYSGLLRVYVVVLRSWIRRGWIRP